MLVSVTGFGSLWRYRFKKDHDDPHLFARGVFYNTTGVLVDGVLRQRATLVGYARFHQCGGFDPHHPSRMVGKVFECAEPCVWNGANKLLFRHVLRKPELPERFLVVVRPECIGKLHVGIPGWRSEDIWLVSLSECHDNQEAMLLMAAGSWIRTELGSFVLVSDQHHPWRARLALTDLVAGVRVCGI